jgi:phage tail-like protein
MERTDPYGAFNFTVELEGIDVAGFTEVSGLDFEIDVIEYRDGDDRDPTLRKIPGLRKYGNITLKRGITDSDAFWDWIVQSLNGPIERRNGRITILDDNREPVARWDFVNAWPCKYRGPHLAATGNEVAIESMELCHEGLQLGER